MESRKIWTIGWMGIWYDSNLLQCATYWNLCHRSCVCMACFFTIPEYCNVFLHWPISIHDSPCREVKGATRAMLPYPASVRLCRVNDGCERRPRGFHFWPTSTKYLDPLQVVWTLKRMRFLFWNVSACMVGQTFKLFLHFWRTSFPFVGPLISLFWTSGDVCTVLRSHGGFPPLHGSLPIYNGFFGFTSGATSADRLAASMMAEFFIHVHVYEHW